MTSRAAPLVFCQFQPKLQADAGDVRGVDADFEPGPRQRALVAGKQQYLSRQFTAGSGEPRHRSRSLDIRPHGAAGRASCADRARRSFPRFNCPTTPTPPPAIALWVGVPILTRRGTTSPAWVATSLLNAIDLPELVTESAADYESLAVVLAGDPGRLAAIRAKLAQNRLTASLFDTQRFPEKYRGGLHDHVGDISAGEGPKCFAIH